MHQPRRDAVIASVVALLCSLGHPAQAFWPSGGLVRQNMNAGRHQHRLESSSPAASTPLPATESSAGGGDAGADDSGEPSSPASHGRRTTWVQPFLPNTPSVSGATSATTHGRVGIVDSCSPLAAPAFVKRKAHYDMSVTAAAEPASPPPAVKVVLESSSSSEPASSADDGGGPPSPASHGRRTTWVQPFLPNAPSVSGATSAATHGRVGIVDSCSPLAAPAFVKRKVHYDMSVTAAAAEPASPPSAPKVAPESSDATASAATKTTAASRRTSSRRTSWIQPSHPPTPVDTTAAKSASDRVASSPSPPGIAPTFLNRPAFYDMSSSPVTAAAEPASPPSAAKVVSESPSPSPETSVTAEKTTTTPPPPSTDTAESSSSSDATASVAAASAAADSSSAEEATPPPPPPPPPAAKAASSPPPPVEFEPEPTLLSDSPVYQDVALTLKRAKETLAPFRKKIQDNVAEGNVGERGEEWALAQFAILLFVAMGSVPLIGGLITLLAGPGLVVGGIGVCLAGVKDLGASLSPWPAPIEDNELNTEGIYGTMRHPMYTGLVMCCLGFGVVTDSPLRMLLAVVLALVLDKKADKEEKMLIGFHGTAYEEYRKVVAKFVPRFY